MTNGKGDPLARADEANRSKEMIGLLREYTDEISRSGMDRGDMKERILALLAAKIWDLSAVERFEVLGLLRVLAAEAIGEGRDSYEDMQAFKAEWGRGGVTGTVMPMAAWVFAREEVTGESLPPLWRGADRPEGGQGP